MRFIVLAPFASLEADRDAAIISVLGDHQATTIYALANADHPNNHGRVPSDAELHAHVVLEIVSGAVPVLHPELKEQCLTELLHVCRYLRKPVVPLAELVQRLFSKDAITQEDIDSLDVLGTLAPQPAAKAYSPTYEQPAPLRYQGPVHYPSLEEQQPAHDHDPGDEQPVQATRSAHHAPERTSHKKARSLGDRFRAFHACLLRWEQRANAFLGYAFKNPRSLELQAKPRPYPLPSSSTAMTG